MQTLKDNTELLKALRKGDSKAFEHLYKNHYRLVSTMVFKNQGNEEDAKELFQDTMVALFKKIRDDEDFELKTQPGTYIYAIARNLWLKKLRYRKQYPTKLIEDTSVLESLPDDQDIEVQETEYEEKHIAVKDILYTLKQECRDIIEGAFFKKLSGLEIAQLLGYTEDFVKVKKFRCMKELKQRVGEHSLFKIS